MSFNIQLKNSLYFQTPESTQIPQEKINLTCTKEVSQYHHKTQGIFHTFITQQYEFYKKEGIKSGFWKVIAKAAEEKFNLSIDVKALTHFFHSTNINIYENKKKNSTSNTQNTTQHVPCDTINSVSSVNLYTPSPSPITSASSCFTTTHSESSSLDSTDLLSLQEFDDFNPLDHFPSQNSITTLRPSTLPRHESKASDVHSKHLFKTRVIHKMTPEMKQTLLQMIPQHARINGKTDFKTLIASFRSRYPNLQHTNGALKVMAYQMRKDAEESARTIDHNTMLPISKKRPHKWSVNMDQTLLELTALHRKTDGKIDWIKVKNDIDLHFPISNLEKPEIVSHFVYLSRKAKIAKDAQHTASDEHNHIATITTAPTTHPQFTESIIGPMIDTSNIEEQFTLGRFSFPFNLEDSMSFENDTF